MSDRAALLSAIRAHPDEDTPRLVYADWLDENGEPDRAKLIREQIAHRGAIEADESGEAMASYLISRFDAERERVDWAAADADLGKLRAAKDAESKLAAGLKAKTEGLPTAKALSYASAERGFFAEVLARSTVTFLGKADAIFRAAPITGLNFQGLFTAEHARALVASGYLARVRSLTFAERIEPDALRTLGDHPDAAGVRALDLSTLPGCGPVVEALAAGEHWSGLRSLNVSSLDDGDDTPSAELMAELFARPQLRGLRTLIAWNCGADDDAAQAVIKNMPEVRNLDLALNPITDPEPFAKTKNLKHIRTLDLSSCDLDGADTAALINSPHMPHLTVLRLDGNYLTGPTAKVLAKKGRGPTLRALDLSTSRLSAAGAEALARCPALRGLLHLSFQSARFTDEHLERFARVAAFDRLTHLNLGINEFKAAGVKALAAAPWTANLQWLDVSYSKIGVAGAKALAASPHLGKLKYLHADGNGAAKHLTKRFKEVFA